MTVILPSRYEDLDSAYRGRLAPDAGLIRIIDKAFKSITITGGIRFLPLLGESGSGKSSASRELSTHMPDVFCYVLSRKEIESREKLVEKIIKLSEIHSDKLLICVVDQYEENVEGKEKLPTQFIEHLSLIDRGKFGKISIVVIWLTTSMSFKDMLVAATSRNKRILLEYGYVIYGPDKKEWPTIIEETFSFHNSEKPLSDYGIIRNHLIEIGQKSNTIGEAIGRVGYELGENIQGLQNISEYQIILLWPVSDSLRSQRVLQFSKPKDGYRLNWDSWYMELNLEDKGTLPLDQYNRTRLYYDFRIIPLRVADLHKLCIELDNDKKELGDTYLKRFSQTHFFHIISGNWETYDYNPIRERESQRSIDAKNWYETVTTSPTLLGKRIAKIIRACGLKAEYEKEIKTKHSTVIADIFVETKKDKLKPKKIIELKAFSANNTMPSTIKEQIKITMRRHAQLSGFLNRQ